MSERRDILGAIEHFRALVRRADEPAGREELVGFLRQVESELDQLAGLQEALSQGRSGFMPIEVRTSCGHLRRSWCRYA
jgi:hypothetical protein